VHLAELVFILLKKLYKSMIIYTKKLEINNEIRNFIAKLYNKKTIVSKLIKVKSLPFA